MLAQADIASEAEPGDGRVRRERPRIPEETRARLAPRSHRSRPGAAASFRSVGERQARSDPRLLEKHTLRGRDGAAGPRFEDSRSA